MARVTVEDCIDKVESPYELVLVAKERAVQLNSGLEPTLDRDNDKNTVISLREIAEEKIKVSDLTESAVYKLRKHVEQVDDGTDDDEIIGDAGETGNPDVDTPKTEIDADVVPDGENGDPFVEDESVELTESELAIDNIIRELRGEELKESQGLSISTAIHKIKEGEASSKKKV